jgi:aryl-alcohol dehydrogenase-like predicted oxidoreductase
MEQRTLGSTGVQVGVLSFGCGAVGGLMVHGTTADQERAVARAVELGINYFDTAPVYGNGLSEQNLGRVLRTLRPDVIVGTKFAVGAVEPGRIAGALTASLEASLSRLGLARVDLLQLHDRITTNGHGNTIAPATLLDEVVPALERLRQAGKVRFFGITAVGDTEAVHRVLDARVIETAQLCYNLLNPSAGRAVPTGFPAHDFGNLLDHARQAAVGTIGIRVLAGGALSGEETRHPMGAPVVDPIASGPNYGADVHRARQLQALVKDGHVGSTVEAALRFAVMNRAMTTVLVGFSTLEQLEYAAGCVERGPLSPLVLERLASFWRDLAGAAA